jgi:hypothetical protein
VDVVADEVTVRILRTAEAQEAERQDFTAISTLVIR